MNETRYRTLLPPSTFILITPAGEMEATREYFISAKLFAAANGGSFCMLLGVDIFKVISTWGSVPLHCVLHDSHEAYIL